MADNLKSNKIIIGIRNSKLSISQTNEFINKFLVSNSNISKDLIEIKHIKTKGDIYNQHRLDTIGGKGLFIKEIEENIIEDQVTLGIHSMKDMPASETNGLSIVCWLERIDPNDVLISNSGLGLDALPSNSVIGTSSIRRRSQVLNYRKDLQIKLLRGNVDTRINKLNENQYDAIILSKAGLVRLGLDHLITETLSMKQFLPAACQGAVGIQCKSEETMLQKMMKKINHQDTEMLCSAERRVLKAINANCNSPVSVYAKLEDQEIIIQSILYDHDGVQLFSDQVNGPKEESMNIANQLGDKILNDVGKERINQLDFLQNDFNYSP